MRKLGEKGRFRISLKVRLLLGAPHTGLSRSKMDRENGTATLGQTTPFSLSDAAPHPRSIKATPGATGVKYRAVLSSISRWILCEWRHVFFNARRIGRGDE